jgi:hypothetical protein
MTLHNSDRRLPYGVALASLALLTVVSGCAQPGPGGGGPGPSPAPGPRTYGPDEVVLRVEYVGGFVPYESLVTRLPIISVYGDGRVITEGPVIAIYPSPALPNVLVRTISMAGVDALVTRALAHGVGRETDLGQPPVADAPSTRFTVLTDAGPQVTEVNALGFGDEDYGLTADQRSARRALRELAEDLADLPKTLGPDASKEQEPYQPKAVAAVSREWTDPGSTDIPAQPERVWPGPTLPGDPVGNLPGLSCVTVTGADVATVLDAASTANVLTPWTSGGHRWIVGFRPLLPEESSCADLT